MQRFLKFEVSILNAERPSPDLGDGLSWFVLYNTKKVRTALASSVLFLESLLRLRSAHRANIGATPAVDAFFRIDLIDACSLADRLNGAFGSASAAADAFVRNLICHDAFLRI
jgi:hypothetical protein